MLQPRLSSCGEVMFCRPILHHTGSLLIIVNKLQFCIWTILIGVVVTRFAQLYCEGLNIFLIHETNGAVIEVDVMYIKESCLVVDDEAPHTMDTWIASLSYLYISI